MYRDIDGGRGDEAVRPCGNNLAGIATSGNKRWGLQLCTEVYHCYTDPTILSLARSDEPTMQFTENTRCNEQGSGK